MIQSNTFRDIVYVVFVFFISMETIKINRFKYRLQYRLIKKIDFGAKWCNDTQMALNLFVLKHTLNKKIIKATINIFRWIILDINVDILFVVPQCGAKTPK